MLKVLIENSSYKKVSWSDVYWAKFFMQEYFKKKWIQLVSWSIHNYNKEKKTFSCYYTVDKQWKYNKTSTSFSPDIIWNRKSSWTIYKYDLLKNFIITPSQKIANIGNDKYENYLFLQKYQPKTFLLNSFFKNNIIQKELPTKIIIKPLRANWWKWISLTTKKELLLHRNKYHGMEELYVVQAFKNFSWWYPWLAEWNHDIRCMFAGREIIETTIRIPKIWDFRSNIWSWGKQIFISKKKLPKELLSMIQKIYNELDITDANIFSMDFAYCKQEKKRYLIEINTSPGTWYYQKNKKKLETICKGLMIFFYHLKTKWNLFLQK